MSRISVSGLMAGNGLRMGSDESAEFPTIVKEVMAMFAIERLRAP